MSEQTHARAVGINHVALEVGDIEEALAFHGKLFDYELRGRSPLDLRDPWGNRIQVVEYGEVQFSKVD